MSTQRFRRGWPALVAGLLVAGGLATVSGIPAGAEPIAAPVASDPAPASLLPRRAEIADGRLVVGLADGVSTAAGEAIARGAGVTGVEAVGDQTLVVDPPDGDLEAARVDWSAPRLAGCVRRAQLPDLGVRLHPE